MRVFGRKKNPPRHVRVPSTMVRALAPSVPQLGYADPGLCYEDDDCAWPNMCIDSSCQPALAYPLLNQQQMVHLRDRALRFQQTVGEALGLDSGGMVQTSDGAEIIAELAATSLFGDDNNMATGQPSSEWQGENAWAQAYYYVRDNLASWLGANQQRVSTLGRAVRAASGAASFVGPAGSPVSPTGAITVKRCDPGTGWCEV